MVRIREFTRVSKADKIDRDAGVLYGLSILGADSMNGRKYTESAMKNACRLYEGKPSNANHNTGKADASVYDRLGVWRNPRYQNGRIFGDFHYLKSHPLAERLVEAAERPDLHTVFGFSHDAQGAERPGSGGSIIESIEEVFSVDLVADPATNRGLYESDRRQNMSKRNKRRTREDVTDDPMASMLPAGGAGDDSDGNGVDGVLTLLQDLVDNAGVEHSKDYIDDLREAMELLSKWATPDSGNDDDGGVDESRRRAYRPGHVLERFARKPNETDEQFRQRKVRMMRSGRF